MIGLITGKIEDIDGNNILINCEGIGFDIMVSQTTLSKLGNVGDEAKVFTYLNFNSNNNEINLFGFATKEEKNMFLNLTTVGGIGPKTAISILGSINLYDLATSIASGDASVLAKVKGIGKKTAERIILELREKIESTAEFGKLAKEADNAELGQEQEYAINVLLTLGLERYQATKKVREVTKNGDKAEDIVQKVLKNLWYREKILERTDDRFITSMKNDSDAEIENKLRPIRMEDYVGQEKIKSQLDVFIKATLSRNEALDHILLYGPPGLGKTTLAHIVANELGVQMKITSGPAIESGADLASILTNLQKNDVLFIDEIHRLNKSVEEILYPAMEDYALDFVVGKGPSARAMRLKIQPFTLIGATTKAGNLSAPLRDRFGILARLENYTVDELKKIILRSAKILDMEIDEDACLELAGRSRGTPRLANRLLKRVRDFAEVAGSDRITLSITQKALDIMEVDSLGLDNVDKRLILTMIDRFGGRPVGLDTLSASTGEDANTIEDVYEPYLLQIGFIARTPRGRICLSPAYEHFDRDMPESIKTTIKELKADLGNGQKE